MSRFSTALLAALAAAGLIGSSLAASAANDNPCLQRGYPAGSAYWAAGANGERCKPFNTYHAPQHDPLATTLDPDSLSQLQHRRVPAKRFLGKRRRR